jgi:hypothetical protein
LLLLQTLFVDFKPSISLLFLVKLCLREYWFKAPSAINSKTLPEYLDELAEAPLALKLMLAPKIYFLIERCFEIFSRSASHHGTGHVSDTFLSPSVYGSLSKLN